MCRSPHRFGSEPIQKVRPPLHHLLPFVQILGAVVDAPNSVLILMRELGLDGVCAPQPRFIQHRRRGVAETMASDDVAGPAERSQRLVDGVVGHRRFRRSLAREHEFGAPVQVMQRLEFPEQFDRLARKRDDEVRDAI